MKYCPLFTLLFALAIAPVTSGNEKREKEAARKNAAIAKFTQRAAKQPQAAAGGQNRRSNFNPGGGNASNAAAMRSQKIRQSPSFNPDLSRSPRSNSRLNSTRRTIQPVDPTSVAPPVLTPSNAGRLNPEPGNRRGGNRVGRDPGNQFGDNTNGNRGGNRNWDGNRNWGGNDGVVNRGNGENRNWKQHRGGHHRNWDRRHRNRNWWLSNYSRFALFGGGYYYWNSGYWYPAYGYDPYFSTYTYDAPLYGYNDLEPAQVIANVQAELQRLGYDPGGVDGQFGPATRDALLNYQQDNGLPVTGEIDEATLSALGLE